MHAICVAMSHCHTCISTAGSEEETIRSICEESGIEGHLSAFVE